MATQPLHRREDLARAALAAKGYSTDDLSVSRLLNSIDSKPDAERRRYLQLLSTFGEPFEGPPEQAPAAAVPPAAAPAVAAASPPAAPLPAGAGPPSGPVPVAADPTAGLDPGAPVAMVPREPAPPEDENLFAAALGGTGDLLARAGVSFAQSAVMPLEGVGALGLRAAGADPAAAGALSGALESTLPTHVQEARQETGRVMGGAGFNRAGLAAVGRRLMADPMAVTDIVAGAAGFLIPMGVAARLLKLVPLAAANPRIAATAGEAIVSGAAALPDLAENDEISLGRVVAGAVGTALATGAVSGAGRLAGGAQIEDIVAGVGPHTGRHALRTAGVELVEEAVEESAQTAVGNVAAEDPIGQGLGGAAIGGMIGGGAMGGAAAFLARDRSARRRAREAAGLSQERAETPSETRKAPDAPQPAPEPDRPTQAQPAAPERAAQPTEAADAGIPRDEGRQEDQAEAQAQEDEVAEAPAPEPSPEPARTAPPAEGAPAAADRPAHQPAVGERGEVVAQDEVPHPVRYEVVDAADVVASNTVKDGQVGGLDPRYLGDLQPRDLSKRQERIKIDRIAQGPDPRRLGQAVAVDTGAPVVGPDMQAEAGNSRLLGIRMAYERGTAGEYRAFVDSIADTAGMDQPVLVRVREDDLDTAQRRAFARASNLPTAAQLGEPEQARLDASLMKPGTLRRPDAPDYWQNLVSEVIPPAEQGPFLAEGGGVTPRGRLRMQGALVSRAYDDPATYAALFEQADPDTAGVRNALRDAAPGWAAMRAHLERAGGADPTPVLRDAMALLRRSREEKKPIQTYFQQGDLLPDATTAGEYGRDVQTVLSWFYPPGTFQQGPNEPSPLGPQDAALEKLVAFTDKGREWTPTDMLGERMSLVQQLEQGVGAMAAREADAEPTAAEVEAVVEAVHRTAKRILPKSIRVRVKPAARVEAPGGIRARGIYWPGGLISIAARAQDPAGTLRHEAIHALKGMGFITESEWARLEAAARKGEWVEKHGVADLYPDLSPAQQIEEAIAAEFEAWHADQQRPAPGVVARVWRRIRDLLAALADRVWPGRSPESIWRAIERGDVAARTPRPTVQRGAPMAARKRKRTPEEMAKLRAKQRAAAAELQGAPKDLPRPKTPEERRAAAIGAVTEAEFGEIVRTVEEEAARIAPKAGVKVHRGQYARGEGSYGFYQSDRGIIHLGGLSQIAVAAMVGPEEAARRPTTPGGIMRHEAIHSMRDMGLFTEREWNMLGTAASELDWYGKHGLAETYAGAAPETMIEEAIAHEYNDWWTGLRAEGATNLEQLVARVFKRIRALLAKIRTALTRNPVLARKLSLRSLANDLFLRVEKGEVGAREPGQGRRAWDLTFEAEGMRPRPVWRPDVVGPPEGTRLVDFPRRGPGDPPAPWEGESTAPQSADAELQALEDRYSEYHRMARRRDERTGEPLEAWELDERRKKTATAGAGTPQPTGERGPSLPPWANTELVQAARAVGEGIRPLLADPTAKERKQAARSVAAGGPGVDRSFVGPGGERIDVDHLDNPVQLARVLTRQIAHLPGWLSDLKQHIDAVGRFPRGNTLALIRTVNIGVDRARRKAAGAAAKALKPGATDAARRKASAAKAKQLNKAAREFGEAWVPGRKVNTEAAWKDVASALIVDPLRLMDDAPAVVEALWKHADDSRSFADAVHALQRETSSSEARNAIQFVDELLERNWQAGADRPSERLIAEASARAWAAAHPYEAWTISHLKDVFASARTALFDRTGGLRRFDALARERGGSVRDAAAAARSVAYVNADPLIRQFFGPVVRAAQALGGTGARDINDYLIARRVIQGDPTFETDAEGVRRIVFDTSKAGPGGLNPETAQAKLDRLRADLGEEGYAHLEAVGEAVRDANEWMTNYAFNHGLLTPEARDLYLQSPAYVPFSVVDHNDPFNQRAGFMPRAGTTAAVNRVLPELGEKMRATLIAGKRNEAVRTVVDQQVELEAAGEANVVALSPAHVDWTADGLRFTPRAKQRLEGELGRGHAKVQWAPLQYSVAGKPQVWAVEQIVADAFHRYGDPGMLVKFGRAMNTLSRNLLLRADPMFVLYDNPGMDAVRGWLALHGARPAGREAGFMRGSLAYARDWLTAFGVARGRSRAPFDRDRMAPHNLRILEAMQQAGILPEDALVEGQFAEAPTDEARGRAGRVLDEVLGHGTEASLEQRAEQIAAARDGAAQADAAGFLLAARALGAALWGSRLRVEADRFLDKAMMFSETPSKRAAALHYAREELARRTGRRPSSFSVRDPEVALAIAGMPRNIADFIRTSIGSPDFYLAGTQQPGVNAALQFFSPSANAMAADAAVATDPKTRLGWWTKLMMLSSAPVAMTVIKNLDLGPPEEDDEPKGALRTLQDRLRRIPRWRLWSDYLVPVGETATGRTVSITGPVEHSLRLPLSLLLLSIDTALRSEKGTGTTLFEEAVGDVMKALPGLSWWIPVAGATLSLASGIPYIDPFRGRAIMSETEMDATTTGQRMLRALGYGLASVGIRNPDLVMSVSPIRKQGEGPLEKLLRVPWIGKVARRGVVVDDQGLRETAEQAAAPARRAAARARQARQQALADAAEIYRETGRKEYARISREYFAAHEGAVAATADARIQMHRDLRVAAEVFPERPAAVDLLRFGTDAEAAASVRGLILDGGVDPRALRRAANAMFAGREGRAGSVRRLGLIHRAIREATDDS